MKHLRWLPFAYFAGVHGFALFAPYAALMLAIDHFARSRRSAPLAIPVSSGAARKRAG